RARAGAVRAGCVPDGDALHDVVNRGTGTAARRLGVTGAIGGKTGSTNDYHGAWLVGFSSPVVAGVWVAFDQAERIHPGVSGALVACRSGPTSCAARQGACRCARSTRATSSSAASLALQDIWVQSSAASADRLQDQKPAEGDRRRICLEPA